MTSSGIPVFNYKVLLTLSKWQEQKTLIFYAWPLNDLWPLTCVTFQGDIWSHEIKDRHTVLWTYAGKIKHLSGNVYELEQILFTKSLFCSFYGCNTFLHNSLQLMHMMKYTHGCWNTQLDGAICNLIMQWTMCMIQ